MSEPRAFTTKPAAAFTIDGEEFHVLGAVPAEEFTALLDIQTSLTAEGIGIREQYAGIKEIFQNTMLPESWERFAARLADRSRPIDFNLLMQITNWLAGEVWSGKEATSSPLPSTEPSGTDGTTSTESASTGESTPLVEVAVVDSPGPTT